MTDRVHLCDTCHGPIRYEVNRFDLGQWKHTDPEAEVHYVSVWPACPDCGSHDIETRQEAWANVTECPCGHRSVYMIGD